PSSALRPEVEHTGRKTRGQDGELTALAATEQRRPADASPRGESDQHPRPVVAGRELVKQVVPPEPAVQGDQIADRDVPECRETADPEEPAKRDERGQRDARGDRGERTGPSRTPVGPPRPADETDPQHPGVGLDPRGGPERGRGAAEPSGVRGLAPVHRRDDARRGPCETDAEQELSLSREPRAPREVIERKEGRGRQPAPPSGAAQRDEETGARREQGAQIERAEREIPRPEGPEQQTMRRIDD